MSEPDAPSFQDHFSGHAATYAKFRPQYPASLFEYLSSLAPARNHAWDCATGNGQAAIGLAPYFDHVTATDASAEQIAHSAANDKIKYKVAKAESSGLPSHSADIVTIAQALHWFDLTAFYAEVERVLVPGGIIAAWSYYFPQISSEIDPLVVRLHGEILGPYWPESNRYILEKYKTVPFPFEEIEGPALYSEGEATRDQFLGYLESWSASQRYMRENGVSPIAKILEQMKLYWDDSEAKIVRHPLYFRIGKTKAN